MNTTRQASRPPAEPIDRKPPPPSASRRSEKRPEASKHRWRDMRQEIRTRNDSTPQSHRIRRPAHRVERRGERRRTDQTDETTNEAKDDTGRWASRTSQHIPHEEMRTPFFFSPPAAEPTGKQTEETPQRKRHRPAIDIGTDRMTEIKQLENADTPRPTPRQPCRGAGRRTGETITDEMRRQRRDEPQASRKRRTEQHDEMRPRRRNRQR